MALIYRPKKSTLANKEGKKKWHLTLVKTGIIVDTQQLGEMIATQSTLTPGDVHNVVRNLMNVMRQELLNSNTVRLDGLGTFTMYARTRSKGVDTEKEVGPDQITALRCQFTPEYFRPAGVGVTRALTNGVKFIHVNQLLKKSAATNDDTDDDGGGPILNPEG